MSKLTALLKNPTQTQNAPTKTVEIIKEKRNFSQEVVSPEMDGLEIFDITDDDLAKVKASVVEITTDGLNRRQIVIGMFGTIKNPKTGERFVIPGVDFSDEDYIYRYAEMMRTLVNRPADFKKIMNWE